MIRLGQSLWINWDVKLYYEKKDTPAVARYVYSVLVCDCQLTSSRSLLSSLKNNIIINCTRVWFLFFIFVPLSVVML